MSRSNYQEIKKLTYLLYPNITGENYEESITNTYNRWYVLAKYWNDNCANIMHNPLYYVIHNYFWSIAPAQQYSQEELYLFSLVQSEISKGKQAFSALYGSGAIDVIKNNVKLTPGIPGLKLYSRIGEGFLEYKFHSTIIPNPRYYRHCFHSLRYPKGITSYKKIIKKIIPKASSWTDAEWVDESNVFAELASLYGIVYSNNNYDDYYRLFSLLHFKFEVKYNPTLPEIFHIENLTFPLAKLIWPRTNLQTFVYQKALLVHNGIVKNKSHKTRGITSEIFGNSWIYKSLPLISTYITFETDEEKKTFFDMLFTY